MHAGGLNPAVVLHTAQLEARREAVASSIDLLRPLDRGLTAAELLSSA
jgi:hypothetical protein